MVTRTNKENTHIEINIHCDVIYHKAEYREAPQKRVKPIISPEHVFYRILDA